MGSDKGFEGLGVWQKSRSMVSDFYSITAQGTISRDYGLKDQMRRAAVSVLSNIAEGFERGGNKEFIQFLYIAKGSAGELRAQMYIAQDQGYINGADCNRIMSQLEEISKMLSGLIAYLRNSEKKGERFRVEDADGQFQVGSVSQLEQ